MLREVRAISGRERLKLFLQMTPDLHYLTTKIGSAPFSASFVTKTLSSVLLTAWVVSWGLSFLLVGGAGESSMLMTWSDSEGSRSLKSGCGNGSMEVTSIMSSSGVGGGFDDHAHLVSPRRGRPHVESLSSDGVEWHALSSASGLRPFLALESLHCSSGGSSNEGAGLPSDLAPPPLGLESRTRGGRGGGREDVGMFKRLPVQQFRAVIYHEGSGNIRLTTSYLSTSCPLVD